MKLWYYPSSQSPWPNSTKLIAFHKFLLSHYQLTDHNWQKKSPILPLQILANDTILIHVQYNMGLSFSTCDVDWEICGKDLKTKL
jgi:hypothetical protein